MPDPAPVTTATPVLRNDIRKPRRANPWQAYQKVATQTATPGQLVLQLYDGIQVSQTQNQTNVTAKVSSNLVDRFVDLWLKKR